MNAQPPLQTVEIAVSKLLPGHSAQLSPPAKPPAVILLAFENTPEVLHIHFYNHKRILLKPGKTSLAQRRSAQTSSLPTRDFFVLSAQSGQFTALLRCFGVIIGAV